MEHDKISVVREYCKARKIPYKINREQLTINKEYCCFSVFNIPWNELFTIIDDMVEYDNYGYYVCNKPTVLYTVHINKKEIVNK